MDDVERVSRALFSTLRPFANPDAITTAADGKTKIPKWTLYRYLAVVAVEAIKS